LTANTVPLSTAPRIAVSILTGFLGCGKTTLLNSVLRHPAASSVLVIVNEFGEIGLDHVLIESASDTVLLLDNGCLCCTVFGELVDALSELYHRRHAGELSFERIVIETSGLADPTGIIQAFLSDPRLERLYRVSAVVTVVDGVNIESTLDENEESVRQIALADQIVISKLDLIEAERRSARHTALETMCRKINPSAEILAMTELERSAVALFLCEGCDPMRGEAAAWLNVLPQEPSAVEELRPHSNRTDVGCVSFIRDEPLPRQALQLFVEGIERNVGRDLLRLKAIVTVAGEDRGPAVIHGVRHLVHNIDWLDYWPFEDRQSRFVLIATGHSSEELRGLVALLERFAVRSAAARRSDGVKS